MKYQHNTNFYVLRPRPITWVVLVLIGIAGWGNAQYWVGYYSRVGVALSIADYACFSQRVSLIPPLVVPLMMSHHGLFHTGIYAKRNMYLYSSRGAYWRTLCRDALIEALIGSMTIMVFSVLPSLVNAAPLSIINWGGIQSLFALMTGASLQADVSLVSVLGAYWAAACMQILAYLLLYGVLECLLQSFAAFIAVLLFNLAFNSPIRRLVWDWASLSYGCWSKPFGVPLLLAGWLAFIAILYLLGHMTYRKVDVL